MGQEESFPSFIQKVSPKKSQTTKITGTSRSFHNPRFQKRETRIECDGLLKLQSTPFKNCIQIETAEDVLFLQNIEITLKYLLESRLNTNKLFLAEDIEKLIESIVYTIAYLQTKGVTYKDVCSENVFYDHGNFKLLPNELIQYSTYEKLMKLRDKLEIAGEQQEEQSLILASPELIIALRCHQQQIDDDQILQKSNVFTLGMMLMEVTTLLPSSDCYDPTNFDILDSVINERIILIEEYYNEKIAKIIANMLDYDYSERMNLKELSIWINRQFSLDKLDGSQLKNKQKQMEEQSSNDQRSITKSRMLTNKSQKATPELGSIASSKVNTQIVVADTNNTKSRAKVNKTNIVYLSSQNKQFSQNIVPSREQRNRIYINDTRQGQLRRRDTGAQQQQYNRKEKQEFNKIHLINQQLGQIEGYKVNQSQGSFHKMKYCNYADQFKIGANKKGEMNLDKNGNDKESVTRRLVKQPDNMYKYQKGQQNSQKESFEEKKTIQWGKKQKNQLKQISHKFYPSVDDIFKLKPLEKSKLTENKYARGDHIRIQQERQQQPKFNSEQQQNVTNNSISRIKEQILKSRKLIEQFKRNEGIKY